MSTAKDAEPQKYHPTSHGPEIFPRHSPVLTSAEVEWREGVVAFLQERTRATLFDLSSTPDHVVIKESAMAYQVGDKLSSALVMLYR